MGAAAILLAASDATAIGMAVGGIVAVLAVSGVFYAIGRGEDRERAQAPPPATPAEEPAPPADEPAPDAQHRRLPASPPRRRR